MLRNKFIWVSVFSMLFSSFVFAQDIFLYDAKGKRDPFIPLLNSDGRFLNIEKEQQLDDNKKSDLKLEGIIYDKFGISYAMVNGKVVRIGETIEDYQILKIEEKKVIFIKDGQISEIELKEE